MAQSATIKTPNIWVLSLETPILFKIKRRDGGVWSEVDFEISNVYPVQGREEKCLAVMRPIVEKQYAACPKLKIASTKLLGDLIFGKINTFSYSLALLRYGFAMLYDTSSFIGGFARLKDYEGLSNAFNNFGEPDYKPNEEPTWA